MQRASRIHSTPNTNANRNNNVIRSGTNLDNVKTPILTNDKKKLSFAMTPDLHAKSSNLN